MIRQIYIFVIGILCPLLQWGCSHEAEKGRAIVADQKVAFSHDHPKLAKVLSKVSDGRGGVNYPWLQKHPKDLNDYLTLAASVPRRQFLEWSKPEQMAFLLNVYNAATIKLIVEHYPVSSIRDIRTIGSVWNLKVVSLFGGKISLSYLENQLLRKEFQASSVHFALVCGSKGCPVLRGNPYNAQNLEDQFLDQTKSFLGDRSKNRVDLEKRIVYLSPIFQWYKEDFGESDAGILDFVATHFNQTENSAIKSGEFKIRYTDFDWQINGSN